MAQVELNSVRRNVYRIDRDDLIVSVEADWGSFASENKAPELCREKVIDRSLWDFVSDGLTVHIYRQLLVEVRKGRSIVFDFRCDSPEQRRFLEMRLTPVPDGGVQFETITKRSEERSSQRLFQRSDDITDELVVTCSWCKKIKTAEKVWLEVEEAIQILGLFDHRSSPQVSHGMCEDCYAAMAEKL